MIVKEKCSTQKTLSKKAHQCKLKKIFFDKKVVGNSNIPPLDLSDQAIQLHNNPNVDVVKKQNLVAYFNIDTEYKNADYRLQYTDIHKIVCLRIGVCVQISSALTGHAKLYKTIECESYLIENGYNPEDYHTTFTEDFLVIQYLNEIGYNASIYRIPPTVDGKEVERPTFTSVLYAHFAFVDILGIFNNELVTYMGEQFEKGNLVFDRRTVISKTKHTDSFPTDFIININGIEYRWVIKIVDSIGVAGAVSYSDLGELAGVELPHKDLGKDKIHDFLTWYIEDKESATLYALGDLKASDCIYNLNKMLKNVYSELELPRSNEIKLTIGSTVSEIIKTSFLHKLNSKSTVLNKKNPLYKPIASNAPKLLKTNTRCQISKLSKVAGGRCHNNNPTYFLQDYKATMFHDIDLSGAYATAMKTLKFPIGYGVTCGMLNGRDTEINLNRFFKMFGEDLEPRMWVAVFDADLKYNQDLIPSWTECKGKLEWTQKGKEFVLDERSGEMTIYNQFIGNGILTSDILELIDKVFSTQQRSDFYKNIKIKAFTVCPKSMCCSMKKFQNIISEEHSDKGSVYKLNLPKHWYREDAPFNNFTTIPLGDTLINKFTALRSLYDKNIPLEKIYNTFYKLLSNVSYGSFVSSFFTVSNVILSNNITAMVRVAMWCTEKAIRLLGCITDGHVAFLGQVLYKYISEVSEFKNSQHLPKLYTMTKKMLVQKKIGYLKPLCEDWETLSDDEICVKIKEHIAKQFPISLWTETFEISTGMVGNVEIKKKRKGLFTFEVKEKHKEFVMQGKSNYLIGDDITECKIRSAQINKEHQGYDLIDGKLVQSDYYNELSPHQHMLLNIKMNPEKCPFLLPAVIDKILKPKEFTNHLSKYRNLYPSDTYLQSVHPSYISVSQFTYKNPKQRKAWVRAYNTLKLKYSESFNLFFINQDGTFNYKECIFEMDKAINAGVMNPLEYFDKSNHLHRNIPEIVKKHHTIKLILKERLNIVYKGDNSIQHGD